MFCLCWPGCKPEVSPDGILIAESNREDGYIGLCDYLGSATTSNDIIVERLLGALAYKQQLFDAVKDRFIQPFVKMVRSGPCFFGCEGSAMYP